MGSLTEKEIIEMIDDVKSHFTKNRLNDNAYSDASIHGIEVFADTLKSIVPNRILAKEVEQ